MYAEEKFVYLKPLENKAFKCFAIAFVDVL